MKKLILQILLLLLVLPAISQSFLSINGTVTDTATGNPIPNQAVTISNDSTGGWVYYHTVYTNNIGYYADTVPVPVNTQGLLYVSTVDCQNYLHQVVLTYMPAVLIFTVNFSICHSNSPCVADFTYNQTASRSFQFYDLSQSQGIPVTWGWDFGDGGTSNIQNPQHVFGSNGWYMVTLSISNQSGCSATVTKTVYASDSTGGGCQAAFMAVPDSMNMPPYTYNFYNQSLGNNISTYTWSFGDGNSQIITFPNNPNVTHAYAMPGTYYTCLKIQSADSSCFDMTCDTLFVGTTGTCHAEFTYYTDTLNASSIVHFTDLSTTATGYITSWVWNFGDGQSQTITFPGNPNVTHTYVSSGIYNACLTIHGSDSTCYDMVCHTVFIGSNLGCQAYFAYSIDPALGNHTVAFTDLSAGQPIAWSWNFGDGMASNIQNPVHTFAGSAVVHTVCLTITGINCTSTFCKDVIIQDSTASQQIYGHVFSGNVPLSMGLVMIMSLDTNVNFQPFTEVSPVDSSGGYYFNQVPDGLYYILAIPMDSNGYLPTYYGNTINWEQATMITLGQANNPYNINLVPSDQMTPGPGSASGQINLGDLPAMMLDKINMILLNSAHQAIGFTQVSTSGGFIFPTMAYGTYYLHAEMPGITSDYIMVNITPEKPHADVTMTFTGNSILGIRNELSLVNDWSAYPNPVTDNLTVSIDMKKESMAVAGLYNMTGQVVSVISVCLHEGNNRIFLPTASLPAGLYTLKVTSKQGLNIQSKVVKTP